MGKCRILFFIFLLYSCFTAPAQKNGPVFYHLTTKNGLSCNRSNAVMQDSKGFYWIATDDGLNRFDGSTCKIFRNVKNDSTSLSVNYCYRILEDDQGDIWVGTTMGVNRYIYKEDRFERFFLYRPTVSFDRINMITGMQKDEKGNIWISSQGLWQYNIYSRKWKEFLHAPDDSSALPAGIISHLQYDKENNGLWMNVDSNRVFFEIKKGKFYHKTNNPYNNALLKINAGGGPFVLDSNNGIWFCNNQSQLSFYSIKDNDIQITSYKISKGFFNLSIDPGKRIWIHYWFGKTIIFDPKTQTEDSTFLATSHPQSALDHQARNLYTDKTGIYWIMSRNGISIYNPNEQAVRYFLLPGDRKTVEGEDNSIYCVHEQDENNVWLGTNTGLCKYDLLKNKPLYFDHLPFAGSIIKCLFLQEKSILWVGTQSDLFVYDINSGKILKKFPFKIHTQFITSDEQGNIWVGTWHNGLYQFSAKGGLIKYFTKGKHTSGTILHNNLIGFKTDSARSHLWIGYNGGYGFCKIDYKENIFTHIKIQTREPYFNAINTINCFSEDNKENLWIGANGGGLFYFNRKDNSFKAYTQSDGLKSNYINAILPDETGHLWIATSNGLNILNPVTGEIINTSIDLEMASNGFLPTGYLRKNKKMLFFSGPKLIEVDPVQFQQNSYPSTILFSSFKIFDKEYSLIESQKTYSTSLSHNQNFFSIEYSLFNPDPNSSSQYAYQLKGFDKEWINARERRIANYTNIPPGNYTFHVKATDASGKNYFSKPILISISPPVWRTWWFISIAVLVVAGSLYMFYRYRLNHVKKIFNLRNKISQDLHDDIGASLSSIHVYSSVAEKAMGEDAEKAKNILRQINHNTRKVMEDMSDIVWAMNAKQRDETSFSGRIKNYGYDLLSQKNIECRYHIDHLAEQKLLKPDARKNILLIVKEALNNIAKYSEASRAGVDIITDRNHFLITITDNGKGMETEAVRKGNGLNNIKERTAMLGGTCSINSSPGNGTAIRCSIPLANISDN